MPINLGKLFVKHATANTFKPASITVEPSDIVCPQQPPPPPREISQSRISVNRVLGTLAIPYFVFAFCVTHGIRHDAQRQLQLNRLLFYFEIHRVPMHWLG